MNWGDPDGFAKYKPQKYNPPNPSPYKDEPDTPDSWENRNNPGPPNAACCSEGWKKDIYRKCVFNEVWSDLTLYGFSFAFIGFSSGPVGIGAGVAIGIGTTFRIADYCKKMSETCNYSR